MTHRRNGPVAQPFGLLAALLATLALANPAWAKLDLTLRREGDPKTFVRPTLRLDTALFAQDNAWAGNARELLGAHTSGWGEFGAVPGLEGEVSLGDAGTLRGRLSGVYTTTQFGLDAAGSNLDDRHPHDITLEDAYVGWKSGKLFPALGEDAIDLSVGAQRYQLGTGFLFYDGSTDGGDRGGYWLGLRNAFERTAIARLKKGPLMIEGMYLRPNDHPDSETDVAGVNLEWTFGKLATVGAGYWNLFHTENDRRDGLDVFDFRFDSSPLKDRQILPGLRLSGEVAYEENSKRNKSWGAYTEVGYSFESFFGKPYLSYRYSKFTGDDGEGSNNAFDPIFYGFYDWGTWYQGEIVGEYVATNRNADIHTVRLRANPIEDVTTNLLYFYFRLQETTGELESRPPSSSRAFLIEDKDIGHELDLTVDWSANDYLTLSLVIGALFPEDGAEDFFGNDEIWSHYMFAVSARF